MADGYLRSLHRFDICIYLLTTVVSLLDCSHFPLPLLERGKKHNFASGLTTDVKKESGQCEYVC